MDIAFRKWSILVFAIVGQKIETVP